MSHNIHSNLSRFYLFNTQKLDSGLISREEIISGREKQIGLLYIGLNFRSKSQNENAKTKKKRGFET